MFYQETNTQSPEQYIIKQWKSLYEFSQYFNNLDGSCELYGFGFSHNISDDDLLMGYHFFKSSKGIFGFSGEFMDQKSTNPDSDIFFYTVVEFSEELFNTNLFKTTSFKNHSFYESLDCGVPIELKDYIYQDEERIFISKAGKGNIDLFISYILSGSSYVISTKIHPNLKVVAKQLSVNKLLEERIKNLKSG